MRSALLASTYLGAALFLAPHMASAVDATWLGPGTEWTSGANWSSTVPDNMATFTNNGAPTAVMISNDALINTIQFDAGAPAYTFNIFGTSRLQIINTGIINNSTNAPTFVTNNTALLGFSGSSTAGDATIINNAAPVNGTAVLEFTQSSTAGNATIINNNGIVAFFDFSRADNATIIDNSDLIKTGGFATLAFQQSSKAGNATIINNTGAVAFFDSSTADHATITTNSSGRTSFLYSSTGGNARFITNAGGVFDMSALTLAGMTAGSIEGAGNYYLGSKTLTVGGNNLSTTVSGVISDCGATGTECYAAPAIGGSLIKTGAGTLTLTGTNIYTGATTVSAGALIVNGSIASSSGLTVDAGATVGGAGALPTTTINGTLSPGGSIGTITVNGNLAFGAGGQYAVELSPTAADRTNVTGTATLAGNVLAIFAPGNYITRQYTILHADQGISGAFAGLSANAPANFNASLSYDANDAFLNLTATLGNTVTGLNQNQVNVANALNGFFNNGGALPPNFASLFGLTGTNLATALSQLSGEAATGAQYGAFQSGNQFFALMLDPLVYGRGPSLGIAPGGGAMRLAAEETQPPEIGLAYAKMILKEPPAPAPILWERRWNVWAGGYGGTNRTQGDPVVVGSHDVTARTGGYGAGIDYRIWPGTTLGVALAGGFTNWGLASGLGGGNSDAFQAGLYGITRNGPAYLAGAASFAEHWMATDRFAFAGDHLTASFNAQSYGGRLESGWRFATFLGGVAPYAAVQAQAFHTPAYNETDATFGGFGLNYNSRKGSDTRSELGARFDRALPIATTAVLALNARAAWAHDWVTTPILNPLFQTLAGALFSVTGATPVPNSALLSAGGELQFLNGWAIGGRFDGEFADRAQTYAGTGTLRYVW